MAKEPEYIWRINDDGTRTRVTRDQFENTIRGAAGRGASRNPQFRQTVRNFRATGRGAAG